MVNNNVFSIAGLQVRIEFENVERQLKSYIGRNCEISPNVFGAYEAFEEKDTDDCVIVYHELKQWEEHLCQKYLGSVGYIEGEDFFELIYYPYDEALKLHELTVTHPFFSIVVKKDFSLAHYIPYDEAYEKYDLYWVNDVFRGLILRKKGVTLHGSAIEYNGKGYIFIGNSGAGKSTQAHLWQRYRNAIVINGDCPVVTVDEQAFVHGTPWCGSSGESINRKTKLEGIVVVQKDLENRVVELNRQDALLSLFQFVIKPEFDLESLDLALPLLEKIVDLVPVYELHCTKDEKAVLALEKEFEEN